MYPEAKSVARWLRHGWFMAVAYVFGFFVMLAILGWHPDTEHKKRSSNTAPAAMVMAFPQQFAEFDRNPARSR